MGAQATILHTERGVLANVNVYLVARTSGKMVLMAEHEPADPISRLAAEWHTAGQRAPIPMPKGQTTCMIPSCIGDGWVQLKTKFGPIVVCFVHFQDLRVKMDEARAAASIKTPRIS